MPVCNRHHKYNSLVLLKLMDLDWVLVLEVGVAADSVPMDVSGNGSDRSVWHGDNDGTD